MDKLTEELGRTPTPEEVEATLEDNFRSGNINPDDVIGGGNGDGADEMEELDKETLSPEDNKKVDDIVNDAFGDIMNDGNEEPPLS